MLEQIKKEKVVDIAGAINKMRHQRMKMVQTHVRLYIMRIHSYAAVLPQCMCIILQDQYIFLHDGMLESVTCGDTEISSANLRTAMRRLNRLNPADNTTGLHTQFKVKMSNLTSLCIQLHPLVL